MEKLDNSMKVSDVKVDDYLAVYIPGGHGKAAPYHQIQCSVLRNHQPCP